MTMWCRNGMRRERASPIGTGTASPRSYRASRRAFCKYGGTIRPRPSSYRSGDDTMKRLLASALFFAAGLLASSVAASEAKHGLSAFGDLAYPPDFKAFNY